MELPGVQQKAMKLITELDLLLRLRMSESINLAPL
jgi:hypothetical protein